MCIQEITMKCISQHPNMDNPTGFYVRVSGPNNTSSSKSFPFRKFGGYVNAFKAAIIYRNTVGEILWKDEWPNYVRTCKTGTSRLGTSFTGGRKAADGSAIGIHNRTRTRLSVDGQKTTSKFWVAIWNEKGRPKSKWYSYGGTLVTRTEEEAKSMALKHRHLMEHKHYNKG